MIKYASDNIPDFTEDDYDNENVNKIVLNKNDYFEFYLDADDKYFM